MGSVMVGWMEDNPVFFFLASPAWVCCSRMAVRSRVLKLIRSSMYKIKHGTAISVAH